MSELAEISVLQCLVSSPGRIDSIAYLKPNMFQNEVYRDIYATYCQLGKEGKEFGVQTVIARLAAENKNYTEASLMEIFQKNFMTGALGYEIESHADIVLADYKKRCAIATIKSFNPDEKEIDENIQCLIDKLQKITEDFEDDGKSIAEITEEVKDNYFKPRDDPMIEFGIQELDDAIGGIDGGDVVVIAARPGVGKSAFTLQAMRQFSAQGKRVAYFNLEMMREQVYERAVASASGIQLNAIRKNTRFHGNEQQMYESGVATLLKESNIVVYQGAWTVSKIRAVQARRKYDVIVVDYLQLLSPEGNRGGNRTAEVGDISRGLKTIATDYQIPMIALSQLNRASETGRTKEPSMTDLRESGAIEQDASVIIMLWQSNENDESEKGVKVEKARQGRSVSTRMHFDGSHMEFDGFKRLKREPFKKVETNDMDIPF